MLLEYAGEAQLYVPVSQLHLISRYSGQAHENVALHKLGSGAWNKAKRKAAEKARDTAAELLNLYAQRAAQSGHKFEINEFGLSGVCRRLRLRRNRRPSRRYCRRD